MLLIVYGSFRSLNMEQEARERAEREKKQNESMTNLLTGEPVYTEQSKSMSLVSKKMATRAVGYGGNVFSDKFATLDTMHALCLPLGASISLLVMFFFFDSMQMLFAVCTASECHFRLCGLLWKFKRLSLYFFSHCDRGLGLPAAPHVSIHHPALHRRQPHLVLLRPIHSRRAAQLLAGDFDRLHLGADRPLVADGRHGNGSVCGVHRFRAAAQPEGVHPPPDRTAHLRRILGVLLIIHIQYKCYG
jgi:Signal peptide peptidase